jgi:hypothetical protein
MPLHLLRLALKDEMKGFRNADLSEYGCDVPSEILREQREARYCFSIKEAAMPIFC